MVFSDTTNYLGLLQHTNFLCNLPVTDTTEYTTANKVRNINNAYRTVLGWIWQSQGGYQLFDDSNLTDIPYFRTDIVSGQEEYQLPANYGMVERIEIKDQGGIWYKMKMIDMNQIKTGLEEYKKTNSIPNEVLLFANSYRLYPASNWSSSDGDSLRVYCTRDIDAFTAADTTQEPGFNKNWHHILAVMAAKDYATAKGKRDLYQAMTMEETKLKQEIITYYGNKNNLEQERLVPRRRQHHAR